MDAIEGDAAKYLPGSTVTDGYFVYTVIADTGDDWLTVRFYGHVSRVLKDQVVPA